MWEQFCMSLYFCSFMLSNRLSNIANSHHKNMEFVESSSYNSIRRRFSVNAVMSMHSSTQLTTYENMTYAKKLMHGNVHLDMQSWHLEEVWSLLLFAVYVLFIHAVKSTLSWTVTISPIIAETIMSKYEVIISHILILHTSADL